MAYGIHPTTSYVKFARGTQAGFDALATKPEDTLFFIYESEQSTTGTLWLGNKQIGDGSVASLAELITDEVADGDLLVYNETNDAWEPLPIEDIIAVMGGATSAAAGSSGLVPAPSAGDQGKFLRGDGTWVTVDVGSVNFDADQFETVSGELSIKGFETATAGQVPSKKNDGSIEWTTPITEATVNSLISQASSLGLRRTIINDISEATSEAYIYLLAKDPAGSTGNLYDEYVVINGSVEKIGEGTTSVDLSNYVQTSVYNAKIANLESALANRATTTSLTAVESRVIALENSNFVTSAVVGDLANLTDRSSANSTIVDELNTLSSRLKWQTIRESE